MSSWEIRLSKGHDISFEPTFSISFCEQMPALHGIVLYAKWKWLHADILFSSETRCIHCIFPLILIIIEFVSKAK